VEDFKQFQLVDSRLPSAAIDRRIRRRAIVREGAKSPDENAIRSTNSVEMLRIKLDSDYPVSN
jgi:hypothetical protein